MKRRLQIFFLFLTLNFAALGLGVYLMNNGPISEWYMQLNQAPWTPPSPVFGIAWTIIMICFAFYMTRLVELKTDYVFIGLIFAIQWILNTGWNYVFFNQHLPITGLITILLLFSVVTYLLFRFKPILKYSSLWILPYFLWLIVAISLNGYIVVYNP